MEEKVLFELKLTEAHFVEGDAKKIIFGQESKLRPEKLKIIRYDNDELVQMSRSGKIKTHAGADL